MAEFGREDDESPRENIGRRDNDKKAEGKQADGGEKSGLKQHEHFYLRFK
jgi:hypothetical protein